MADYDFDAIRKRFEDRAKAGGQRRVNARFEVPDLERLAFLTQQFGTEADALREAVRLAYETLQRQQRRIEAQTKLSR